MADPIDHYRRVWALQNFDDADLGSRFYRDAWSWCTSRTQLYGLPARDIAYCVAAISPMKKWDENLRPRTTRSRIACRPQDPRSRRLHETSRAT
jgi:hypothetical protein